MNHTPGPWTIHPPEDPVFEDHIMSGDIVLVLKSAASEADMRLIAAAPSLLEALRIAQPHLREYVDYHNNREGCSTEMEYACDMVEAAIAKAEASQ